MKLLILLCLLPVAFASTALPTGALAAESAEYYTCPMHPEVHAKEPSECPICHMKLKKVGGEPKAKPSGEKRVLYYRNPMNPAVTSKTPTQDGMGMDYIPVYEAPSLTEVPGRGTVKLDETRLALSGTSLVSVAKGDLVSEIPVSGRAISPNQVSLQVSERDLPAIKPGLEARLSSPSTGGTTWSGRISSLDAILDPMTRSLRVDVQVSQTVSGLRAEASVSGSVLIERKNTLIIPESAILYLATGPYVYVVDSEKDALVPRKIRLGLRNRSQAEVLEGLRAGERISAGPNFLIDSESRIQAAHD